MTLPPRATAPVVAHLERLGGVATWTQLVSLTSRPQLDRAVGLESIVKLGRGRYALTTAREARQAAHRVTGIVVCRSAAAHWGWAMKWQPSRPEIAVPRGRKVSDSVQRELDVCWRSLAPPAVVDGWVTSPPQTVLDCMRALPFDEGLSIADSALRSGILTPAQLEAVAAGSPGRGHALAVRVAAAADARAANPFESVLRATACEVSGLMLVPQVRIESRRTGRFVGRVDLADESLRIVAEADSFEFHGERQQLDRDCERYDELVVDGWVVLRFSWKQVMKRPAWVRAMLRGAVDLRTQERRAA
ncbi:MAG: DUF559 domain-containing protein [Lapillicoccus sp.]